MRHMARIKKKRKPLTFYKTNKLLHSFNHKSTYFYKQQWFSTYSIPLASTLGLLLVLGISINPFSPSSNGDKAYAAGTATAGTVSLTMNGSTDLSRNLTSGNTGYVSSTFKVEAGTGLSQYQVVVQAANGYSSSLVGAATKTTINGISGSVKGNALANNTWGYALQKDATYTSDTDLANMTYQALPGSGSTTAAQTVTLNNAAATHNYTLAFAANIKDKTADHYQTSVLLSVAAGASETVTTGLGFNGITEMQQMTSTVCSTASEGLEGRLKDTRDEKVYWVGKLKDGNCWMTQNLDLDLSTSRTLTSATSDVISNWAPNYSTQNTLSGWANTETDQRSYDPGNYYYTTPITQNTCENTSIGLSACVGKSWANISGELSTWTTTHDTYFINAISYVGTDGQSICTKAEGSIFGDGMYSQCRIYYGGEEYADYVKSYQHYHAGNYYSYAAATAGGTSSETVSSALNGTICPKGWTIPTGGGSGQYITLVSGLTASTTNETNNIKLAPYYFVYSGLIYSGNIRSAGSISYYWSSMGNKNYAYYLGFDTGFLSFTQTYNTHVGFSVRCVAR